MFSLELLSHCTFILLLTIILFYFLSHFKSRKTSKSITPQCYFSIHRCKPVSVKPLVYETLSQNIINRKRTLSHTVEHLLLNNNNNNNLSDDDECRLSDIHILEKLERGTIKSRELEQLTQNCDRAVKLRRNDLAKRIVNTFAVDAIPSENYDYKSLRNQCCEEVIGYITVPVGKVGPIMVNNTAHYVPMATTEGCLIASTNRGCRLVGVCGGFNAHVYRDSMTRAPILKFSSAKKAIQCKSWIESEAGFNQIKSIFESTSSHADLQDINVFPIGREIHVRFSSSTGSAMGMNIISKGCDKVINYILENFLDAQLLSISGNMCCDKKASAINAILGRGKSVIAECTISPGELKKILKVSVDSMVELGISKLYRGSAYAGGSGIASCNAHAANVVAAIFCATGQDLAQVVTSSGCCTVLEKCLDGSLYASVTMNSLEIGVVGGGTRLEAQRACIQMMDLSIDQTCDDFAEIIACSVLSAELSLLASLVENTLVSSHLKLNRSVANVNRTHVAIS